MSARVRIALLAGCAAVAVVTAPSALRAALAGLETARATELARSGHPEPALASRVP